LRLNVILFDWMRKWILRRIFFRVPFERKSKRSHKWNR
jgi:hypothetical protein